MYIKSQVELIYVAQGVAENGSPLELFINKSVKCNEMQTFSANYYNDQQRNMRTSRNLVIPTYLTEDLIELEDDCTPKRYELMYCKYDGRKYKVKNILKMRDTRLNMILDVQEVR